MGLQPDRAVIVKHLVIEINAIVEIRKNVTFWKKSLTPNHLGKVSFEKINIG